MMEALIEMHIVFRGEVQGVGFRATTRRLASQLGLCGTVRNLTDGAVELIVQGQPETIHKLLKQLKESHFKNEIISTEETQHPPTTQLTKFEIVR